MLEISRFIGCTMIEYEKNMTRKQQIDLVKIDKKQIYLL